MKSKNLFCIAAISFVAILTGCVQNPTTQDTTPPANVTEFNAISEAGKITLTWKDPQDSDFYGTKIYTGVQEVESVNFDKGIIVGKGSQKYSFENLKDDGIYTFRISTVDTSFNESSFITSEQLIFKTSTVQKKNNKFVCPECKTEYSTDEEAAKCHGATLLYSTKLPAGTYKVYHLLQDLDLVNFSVKSTEEAKSLLENSTIENVKKEFTGFNAKSISYNKNEIYVYYNRNIISYTFNAGSQGGFIVDGSGSLFGKFATKNSKTLSGYFGAKVPSIEKPKSESYGFDKWNKNVPKTFEDTDLIFDAEWISIQDKVGTGSLVYGANDFVMLSKDCVNTATGKSEINPFLMSKNELTYSKWKDVHYWSLFNDYTYDTDDFGAAGNFILINKYVDSFTNTEYPFEIKNDTYTGYFYFYDSESDAYRTEDFGVTVNLEEATRSFELNGTNYNFEYGNSLILYNDNVAGLKYKLIDEDDYIPKSKVVDYSNYVYVESFLGPLNGIYLNPAKYPTTTTFTGDDYIKPADEHIESGYDDFFTEDGENFVKVKNNLQNEYTGTDIIFDLNGEKYFRLENEYGETGKYYITSTYPNIVKNEYGSYFVINKNNSTAYKIEINDTFAIVDYSNGTNYSLLDYQATETIPFNKVANKNYYSASTSYGTVLFTSKGKMIKKVSSNHLEDKDSYYYPNDPVTRVNWLTAAVWCNAASEKDGLTPVYYKPGTTDFSDSTKVIRDARIKYEYTNGLYNCTSDIANAVVNTSANGYRLPTEEEWEYAARGGDPNSAAWTFTYSGSSNINDVAWYYENSNLETHPVGLKAPNTAGLYDMSGNVFEFCFNKLMPAENYCRISTCVRGGSWSDPESFNQIAERHPHPAFAMGNNDPSMDSRYNSAQYNVGFRIVRSVIE